MYTFRLELLEQRALLATAAVDRSDARQTIDGFGASSAWFSGTIPVASLSLLYSPPTGICLSHLRSRTTVIWSQGDFSYGGLVDSVEFHNTGKQVWCQRGTAARASCKLTVGKALTSVMPVAGEIAS